MVHSCLHAGELQAWLCSSHSVFGPSLAEGISNFPGVRNAESHREAKEFAKAIQKERRGRAHAQYGISLLTFTLLHFCPYHLRHMKVKQICLHILKWIKELNPSQRSLYA